MKGTSTETATGGSGEFDPIKNSQHAELSPQVRGDRTRERAPLPIGTTLCDRYKVEKLIGKGSFGDVYRGRDLQLKRDVAIKVLVSSVLTEKVRRRFLAESESMAKLMHPNIAAVFDSREWEGRPFIVMELVEGLSVYDALVQGKLALSEIVNLGVQVCHAMAYAHDKGIMHRDLTLRNIILASDGNPKVVDFGLAKMIGTERESSIGVVVGTPVYLAPEQAIGDAVDGRTDVFAFGVCLYRLLNGRFPFQAEHPASLLYHIAHDEPAAQDARVPQGVQQVVTRCLEKSPQRRYQTFGEVAEALRTLSRSDRAEESWSSTQPIETQPILRRGSRQNPYLNRVMIENPDDFFGRAREVTKIFARLDAPHPQSISIVGERRLGKSSLLNFVYQRSIRRLHMQNHDEAVFAYLDFQRGRDLNVPKFIDILVGMFNYERCKAFSFTTESRTLDQLKDVVEDLHNEGKRAVVLMDEFEAVTKNPNFDMEFFSFLRFLANNYRVAYVTSSLDELQQMCHHEVIADSPFFNIFSNLPLRPFAQDEALDLIRGPSEREGVPLEEHAERILGLSGLFPLLIQVACSNAFEHILDCGAARPDWEAGERSFKDEAHPHFRFIWDKMTPPCRETLLRVAQAKKIERQALYVEEDLRRRGYLRGEEGACELFSGPFRDFVIEQGGETGRGRSIFSRFGKRSGG